MSFRNRAASAAVVCFVLAGAAWAASALWRARTTISEARTEVARRSEVRSSRAPWTPPIPAARPILGAYGFRDAAAFDGRLWLAGDGGIFTYSKSGEPESSRTPGIEIPPAAVTALAVGLDPAADRPALFAATAGEGLLVFSDADSFEQIRAADSADRDLTAVLPLNDGRVLLGTQHAGVLVLDANGLSPLHPDLRGETVTALAGDEDSVWIGTLDAGAVRFAGGAIQRIDQQAGLPDDRVLSLFAADQTAFVGTAAGVAEIRGATVERTWADGVIATALAVGDGRLRVGSFDQGVAEIALDAARRAVRAEWRDDPEQPRAFVDLGGELYAVAADGLYPLGSGAALIPPAPPLADRNVSALLAASDGRLWVGWFDRGLDLVESSGARSAHVEDETVFCVNRIVEDADRGVVHAATANGLASLSRDGRVREVRRKADGLMADHVTDLLLDDDRVTLAGPAGLTFLGPGGPRGLYALQGLVNNHVYALGARGGELLAGTLGGVSLLEGERVSRSWTTANSALGHNWITAVEPFGEDWFLGTYGAGVVRLRTDGSVVNADELADVEINPNALTVGETVYAGSLDRGLLVYNPTTQRWTAHTAGLPSRNVTALDVFGDVLYVGTDNGLVEIPESAISSRE